MIDVAAEKLDSINRTLQKQNEILSTLKQVESPATRIVSIVGSAVGILGTIQFVDIVINWIKEAR